MQVKYTPLMLLLAQSSPGPAGAFVGVFMLFWCCGIGLALGQFVAFIVALVQILSRQMPTDAKILWCCVTWFVPVIGPILWWTIGCKQNSGMQGPQVRRPPEQ